MNFKRTTLTFISEFCQAVYRLVTGIILLISFDAKAFEMRDDYTIAVSKLAEIARVKQEDLLHTNRNHRFYLHKEKKQCVVLMLHGLFQSPLDQRGISEHFFKLGCNVVAPLLAGHWEKNELAFHKISSRSWVEQSQKFLDLSLNLGGNLFIIGHSTGGLLGFNLARRNPEKIKGLVLISPALQLTNKTILLSLWGAFFDLNRTGNTIFDPDYDSYKKPARAGYLVVQLNQTLFGTDERRRWQMYRTFKTPTFIFSTEDDETISHDTLLKFHQLNRKLISIYAFNKGAGVFHDNIQRGPIDVVQGAPSSWTNPFFNDLLSKTTAFVFGQIHP